VLTAYVRLVGGSLGCQQRFIGPMAKQHRMATLTLTCLLSILEVIVAGYEGRVLALGLAVIGIGAAITVVRRVNLIAAELKRR